ncbi:uroporphyrinogen decarboxylase [Corynebacterium freneyi]|uniref:Uroporphyrinogen decarboxylase n=1 Tax=Corynebacterium freneyi TaxID=134034 RepID=A0ABS4U7I8_9CORY|nr:uroporphyrinogen decarboxylase [Corynebacterium freneyi]MBP2332628.1 uroporphyrinogen decarboxylase [Corynebacterium freneyi]QXA53213.1 uroporphyrinogen decarboxylase [Corynebacterium freneyi]UBI01185.1 uroporphyrinogen decarboxylase [Corynebacterium freneyi]WJZ05266.1 Uroporphyrinogen decarboxylase [Corynebacterium freneyi]
MSNRRNLSDAPFLEAAAGRTPSRRPVWFMRQAGRSLPEYREIRKDIGMLDSCFNSELLAEITMQPVRRHDVDAAILFSDIVVPVKAAGVDLDIVAGRGPVVAEPIRTASDIDRLPELDPATLQPVADGIAGILEELTDRQALIGFAGAPFTLASYLVEGGPSRNHERTKALMHSEPEQWDKLMRRITPIIVGFLRVQIEAGIDAMQLFDSWAGFLTERDYRRHVLPYSQEIFESVADAGIPRIHFGVGTGELLGAMAEAGSEVVGVDWRVPLDAAAQRISNTLADADPAGDRANHARVLQGNLDPAMFFAGDAAIESEVRRICAEADRAIERGTARGHIFNLGHGVPPNTDADAITRTVKMVHEL